MRRSRIELHPAGRLPFFLMANRSANCSFNLTEINMAGPVADGVLTPGLRPRVGDALVVVDLQQDFLPGGPLAVPGADLLTALVNERIRRFQAHGCPVVATRDWHPANHCSFTAQGGLWPIHCVQDTTGARFAGDLELPPDAYIASKGTDRDREAYSAFADTHLAVWLRDHDVRRLFLAGVATEYCVVETARDALRAGFEVVVLADSIRALNPAAGQQAIRSLLEHGALLADPTGRSFPSTSRRGGADSGEAVEPAFPSPTLLTDLYQLTMMQGYYHEGMEETAVFEFFARKLPAGRNFFVAAGLEQVLGYLESLRFRPDELEWLARRGQFRPDFLDRLSNFRFSGEVHAMPEGSVFFPHEPILRVTAPLPEAQFVESRIINLLQFQTLIASKAARSVLVAQRASAAGKLLVDFGMRRAHGFEAGLFAARAAYLAGFAGTATVLAGKQFGIPLFGTMAHSFVQAHEDELDAFEQFARANPGQVTLLIDTYDTEAAAAKLAELAARLRSHPSTADVVIQGVRLDSGDLADHARRVRRILDDSQLRHVTIFASGNLDEWRLRELLASGAPIDGFGIGSRLDVSADAPYLDCAYKLQEYAGRARRKRSEGKATWPGRKQVFRRFVDGRMAGDTIALEQDHEPGEPLLKRVMAEGRRLDNSPSLAEIRELAALNLAALPEPLRQLEDAPAYPVQIADSLRMLAQVVDAAPGVLG
jgi:nicotinate phosphoribosyltransferase